MTLFTTLALIWYACGLAGLAAWAIEIRFITLASVIGSLIMGPANIVFALHWLLERADKITLWKKGA